MDSAKVISTIIVVITMTIITVVLVSFLFLLYWILIGSRLPPNIKKLKEKSNIAGLKNALDYLNLQRDFWNVRREAAQALGEISLISGDPKVTRQAVESLFYSFQTGGKAIDLDKLITAGSSVTYGKISAEKFRAYNQRIDQVRLFTLQTLGQVGTKTQDPTLRSFILDEFIKIIEQWNNSSKNDLSFDREFGEEVRKIVVPFLETMTEQNSGNN
jgi:hypothetical protein